MSEKKPTYRMKAETGVFKGRLQGQGDQEPEQIQGMTGAGIVAGVVQMHNALLHTTKALQESNEMLMQVRAAAESDEITQGAKLLLVPMLDRMIQNNNEVLGEVKLDRP